MISRQADIFPGELPEPVKDLLWDDEIGFFQNALRWGGRALWVAPWSWMILNTVAGLAGYGLEDLGKYIDDRLAGVDPATADPKALADKLTEELYPKLEARAGLLQKGIIITGAKSDPITFESTQPDPTEQSAPSVLAPPLPQPQQPLPPQSKDEPHSPDEESLGRKEKIKAKYKKKIEKAKAKEKMRVDEAHATTEADKFHRERTYMEEQLKFKNGLEGEARRDAANIQFHKELAEGKYKSKAAAQIVHSAINGNYLSSQELDRLYKSIDKGEREAVKKKLEFENMKHKQDMRHAAERAKFDLKNAKVTAAAQRGESKLLSVFKGRVGKIGVAAAIAALLFAGFKSMTGKSHSSSGQPTSPAAEQEQPRQTTRPSKAPASKQHTTSNKSSHSMSEYVNTELKSILGN